MPTLLISNPHGLDHAMPEGHPERAARLATVNAALSAPEFSELSRMTAPSATEAQLRLAHPQGHIDRIRATAPESGFAALDADTFMSPGSWKAAIGGVGGCIAAVDAVLEGRATNAFVATRPPGHHTERDRAMGFSLFSNIAIAALHALRRRGVSRVAVVDFDVHHGNGTQDVLQDTPAARFVSTHQMPLYPGTGAASERGGSNNILNCPLDPGTGSADMRRVYEGAVFPRLRAWKPDLILISAGFDAHVDDPLANLNWRAEDFGWITREICAAAADLCGGRVVSALEGGYDLEALAASVAAHVGALMEAGK